MLLITLLLQASGLMHPTTFILVDGACEVRPTHSPALSADPDLRVTGYRSGTSSAPGGPSTTHYFPLEAEGLSLQRVGCTEPESQRFVADGLCQGPVFRFEGALLPGTEYMLRDDRWSTRFKTAGAATAQPCPGA